MTTRKHNAVFVLIVAAAAAMSFPVLAQDPPSSPPEDAAETTAAASEGAASQGGQTWASVDSDGDGAISKSEAAVNAGLAQVFDAADADKDGKLTTQEYSAYVASQKK